MYVNDLRQNKDYHEKDPSKKNMDWANRVISTLRRLWTPIVDYKKAKKNMDYLMSNQDLANILSTSFKKDSSYIKNLENNSKIIPIAIWERIRNILISEMKKAAMRPQVNAIDPAASYDKKRDRFLLQNRAMVEIPTNDMLSRIGDPPYKIPKEKFAGNVELFDELGLDENDQSDLSFFFNVFHRLDYEIAAQNLLLALMKYTEFENDISYFVNDVLAKKTVCFQIYTSPFTGEIKRKYINPNAVKSIRGTRRDFKDALCIGYENKITVLQFLEIAGPNFDFERDRHHLLQAILFGNNYPDWVELNRDGVYDAKGNCVASWHEVLKQTVSVGYIEWKSIDASARKRNKNKPEIFYEINFSQNVSPNSIYEKEVTEVQNTYKSWYLVISPYDQYLFHYGKLYHQLTEGAHDEYSSYTICAYQLEGITAVEAGETFVDIANKALYKLMWAIDKSLPRKRIYHYDSLVELAKNLGATVPGQIPNGLQPNTLSAHQQVQAQQTGIANKVEQLIEKMVDNIYEIYTTPTVEGQKINFGGTGSPHYYEQVAGIDPLAIGMQTILDWAENQIMTRIGFNNLREAYNPEPRESLKLNLESLNQSRYATGYVSEMLAFCIKESSNKMLLRAQDGLMEKNSLLYKFIKRLIGEDNVEAIKSLDGIAQHRFGIFVDVYNSNDEMIEFKQDAAALFQKQEINYDQYMIAKQYDDPKMGMKILALFRRKNEKDKMREAEIAHTRAMQLEKMKLDAQMALEDLKGKWRLMERNAWGNFYFKAHQTMAETNLQKKQLDIENNLNKLTEKATVELSKKREEMNLEAEKPLPENIPMASNE